MSMLTFATDRYQNNRYFTGVNSQYLFILCLLVTVSCLISGAALAETRLGATKFGTVTLPEGGKKSYGENFIKKDEIVKCLSIEKEMEDFKPSIAEFEGKLVDKTVEINEIQDEISEIKAALEEQKKKGFVAQAEVDKYNKEAEDCNAKIETHKKLAEEQSDLQRQYNSTVEEYNAKVELFRADCATKQFYEDDYVQAMAEVE